MKDLFIYTRTFELLVITLVGTFICYLGYRLFLKGLTEKSDLNVEYNRFKLQLFGASPGIFFSLLGAIIIVTSVWNVAKFQEEQISKDGLKTKTIITKGESVGLDSNNLADLKELYNSAYAYHVKGDIDHAEELYGKILRAVPEMNKTVNNLADIYNLQGKQEQALTFARFCVLAYPEFSDGQKTLEEIITQ